MCRLSWCSCLSAFMLVSVVALYGHSSNYFNWIDEGVERDKGIPPRSNTITRQLLRSTKVLDKCIQILSSSHTLDEYITVNRTGIRIETKHDP